MGRCAYATRKSAMTHNAMADFFMAHRRAISASVGVNEQILPRGKVPSLDVRTHVDLRMHIS
jgi:hypothetical protein